LSLLKSNKARGIIVSLLLLAGAALWQNSSAAKNPVVASTAKPALTVITTMLKPLLLQQSLHANGSVVAWQEAIIGSEVSGVRISDVRVSIGDQVAKGQVLATLSNDTLQANEAESQAALRESEAVYADAAANAARMKKLADSGFISAQQAGQALTAENTARAKLDAQRARLKVSTQRLAQQNISAPDSGVISARNATVGAITQPGGELFRLIRQGRLEWHADVTADELVQIKKGLQVELMTAQGNVVQGVVRAISPAINPQTRYGQVLVDLPHNQGLVAGMFLGGNLLLGEKSAMVLPQSAVMVRDKSAFVYRVGSDSHVVAQAVIAGRRQGTQIEIISGLEQGVPVVESGGAFLVDGDQVRVTAK